MLHLLTYISPNRGELIAISQALKGISVLPFGAPCKLGFYIKTPNCDFFGPCILINPGESSLQFYC